MGANYGVRGIMRQDCGFDQDFMLNLDDFVFHFANFVDSAHLRGANAANEVRVRNLGMARIVIAQNGAVNRDFVSGIGEGLGSGSWRSFLPRYVLRFHAAIEDFTVFDRAVWIDGWN